MKYKITDDSGFLALVNSNTYNSFLKEEWKLHLLFNHFVTQMNLCNISIWKTNNSGGGYWNVNIVTEKSNLKSVREFTSKINVTHQKLYLTNFEDLSMAASYTDEKIPAQHNSDLFYKLENGLYTVTVRQFFYPNNYKEKTENILDFEIVIKPTTTESKTNLIKEIIWEKY